MQTESFTVHGAEDLPRRPGVTLHFDGDSLSCGRFGVLSAHGLECSTGPWVWLGPGIASVGRAVRLRSGDRVVRLGARERDFGDAPRRAAVIGQVDIVLSPRDLRAVLTALGVTGEPAEEVFELIPTDRARRFHALAPAVGAIGLAVAFAVTLAVLGLGASTGGRVAEVTICLIVVVWGVLETVGRTGRMATPERALTVGPDEVVLYGRHGVRLAAADVAGLATERFSAPRRQGPVLALSLDREELVIGSADPDLAGDDPVRAPRYLVDGRWQWHRLLVALKCAGQ